MAQLLIRRAELDDFDDLRTLFRRASLVNAADRASLLAHPDALELADAAIREGRTRVAVEQGRVVGFATTSDVGGALELDDLFVDPDRMRRGVGRELVLDAVATARERGVRRIEVTANPHALAFYASVGFVAAGDVETRFGPAPRRRLDVPELAS